MQKLFQVNTTVAELDGCKDVIIDWYFDHRRDAPLVPYGEAIEDYDPRAEDVRYSEDALNEYFSQAEAEAMLSWLVRTRPAGHHEVRAIKLPIPNIAIGSAHIPVGGARHIHARGRGWPTVCNRRLLRPSRPCARLWPRCRSCAS